MRRSRLVLTLLAGTLLAAFTMTGATSSAQGQEVAFLNITKVVDGDGPTGGYVIEYSCTDEDIDRAGEGGGGGGSGGALAFDAAGPGAPETQTIELGGPGVCTVTETGTNGADSVTYTCEYIPGGQVGAADGAFAPEGLPTPGCLDDQSGRIISPNDQLNITVTNAFDADVLPDDVEPDVVAATPAFTG
jgi:hypothetical protein